MKHLPKELHIVAVELPGCGGSTYKDNEDLSMLGMTNRVHKVHNHLHIQLPIQNWSEQYCIAITH